MYSFLAKFAADALSRGLVKTWSELFAHLRSYSTPGLIDINGRPLSDDSPELKQVIIDVEFTNDRILGFLKKEPQILWQLSPRKFEEIVAELLISKGYDIELTPASGDGGIDIYAAKKDDLGKFLYLVECKKYVPPSKVGVEVVRSLHGVVQSKKATAGAIVTTSYFTKGAAEFQREIPHQMGLHDYFVLQHWINDFPIARH